VVPGIIVSEYCEVPSHWNSSKTITQWLKENDIPAIYDIDTRALIKIIREKGSLAGKIVVGEDEEKVPFIDIGKRNLVAEVSAKEIITYTPKEYTKKVIVVDCGAKINQLRYFPTSLFFSFFFFPPKRYLGVC
jgi:carbamoylphosphate synthase small subunit